MPPMPVPFRLFLLPPLLALTLSGCSNEGAAYQIDGPRHAISVERKKDFFWQKSFRYAIIVSRLPDCQRKHALQSAGSNTPLELWQTGSNTYILRVGQNAYLTETQTCEGFSKLDGDPPGGYGQLLGSFRVTREKFGFTLEEPEAPEAETPATGNQDEPPSSPT